MNSEIKYYQKDTSHKLRPSLEYMEANPIYKQQVLNTFGKTKAAQTLVEFIYKERESGGKDRMKRVGGLLNRYSSFNHEIIKSNLKERTKGFLIKEAFLFHKKLIEQYLFEEGLDFNHEGNYTNGPTMGNYLLNVFHTEFKKFLKLAKKNNEKI